MTSSSGRELDWSEITAPPSEASTDVAHAAGEAVHAPQILNSEAHLEIIHKQNTDHEEILGLETMAKANDDVWLVYGGLMEEYIRLRSRMGPLGQGVGEGLDGWM